LKKPRSEIARLAAGFFVVWGSFSASHAIRATPIEVMIPLTNPADLENRRCAVLRSPFQYLQMTVERENVVIATALRHRRDAEKSLAVLRSEAKALASSLRQMSDLLSGDVGRLWFKEDADVAGKTLPERASVQSDLDGARIRSITLEYRQAEAEFEQADKDLRDMGF
jgi:hypothetical protein